MPPNQGSTSYPTSSMAGPEPYPKMPLSGAPSYTAEPQEMPIQQTSMPSMQVSLVAQDQQPSAPIRTQYATYASAPPPHLSLPSTADSSLNVPRYVDNNPRPSKSPRHGSHGSLTNETASGEYRYGPPSYLGNSSSDISPQSQHHPPTSGAGGAPSGAYGTPSQEGGASASSSAPTSAAPPRDYFPPSQSWTSTAGEGQTSSYSNGGDRSYSFPTGVKTEPHSQPPHSGAPVPGVYGNNHYAWNAT